MSVSQLRRRPWLPPIAAALLACLQACGDAPTPTGPTPGAPLPSPTFGPVAIAPDGVTFIAGDRRPFFCAVEIPGWTLPLGSPVPLGIDSFMTFAGQTRPPLPSIFLNFASLNQMPVPGQIFLFAHECGHVNSGAFLSEVAANCWAARRLSAQRVLSASEWEIVRQVLLTAYPFPVGPYPSGADQWAQIQTCR